jgi:hypothetical protein
VQFGVHYLPENVQDISFRGLVHFFSISGGAQMPASLPTMINKWVIVLLRYPRLKLEAPAR